jgi:regulator of cell morphogenesis and NO signaling
MRISDRHITIGRLVAEVPARARICERWGIDYCCGGNQPLDEVAAARDLNIDQIVQEMESVEQYPDRNWVALEPVALIQHILRTHHAYLHEELPALGRLVEKVFRVHGEKHPELAELKRIYDGMAEELEVHMLKEERVLFPMLERLLAGETWAATSCGGITNPLRVMRMEHEAAGEALTQLRHLTGGYVAPEGACNSYRAMLGRLEQLEKDTHEHVHKEENILFPRFTR